MPPPPSLTVTTLPSQCLPPLARIDPSTPTVLQSITPPVKRIHSDEDLLKWKNSTAYANLVLFVGRLGEAAVGKETRWPRRQGAARGEDVGTSALASTGSTSGIAAVVALLETLHTWTKDIEPKTTPQRFGNLAFRDWGSRLEERIHDLHAQVLSNHAHLHSFIPELSPYLLDSFGSFVRIDYGSGHEVNFIAWLGLLFRLGFFDNEEDANKSIGADSLATLPTAVEEDLALEVFPLYLQVVWELQDRYALEPAGSHGVWGLDDYHFVPYIIGSAQLRLQTAYLPSHFSSRSHKPSQRLSPSELLRFLPTASTDAPPPFPNLFTSSISRIHSLKTGPFHEHSPLLYDVSTSVLNWVKVNRGMIKMWEVEVLGKRPVVQHFPFGGVGWLWEGGESRNIREKGETGSGPMTGSITAAPAQLPATRAPWASTTFTGSSMPSLGVPARPRGANPPPSSTSVSGTAAPWAAGGTSAPWARKG